MAKTEYILSLIKSHFDSENERFVTLALQIAAHEAKLGHTLVADEIKKLIDKHKESKAKLKSFPSDLQGLVIETRSIEKIADLIAPEEIKGKIQRN